MVERMAGPLGADDRRTGRAVGLGDAVQRVVESLGGPGASSLGRISQHWVDVVGDTVAAHAEPRALRDGTLVVGVHQPGWATQLRFLEPEMLRRIAERWGDDVVRRIEVRVLPPT